MYEKDENSFLQIYIIILLLYFYEYIDEEYFKKISIFLKYSGHQFFEKLIIINYFRFLFV